LLPSQIQSPSLVISFPPSQIYAPPPPSGATVLAVFIPAFKITLFEFHFAH